MSAITLSTLAQEAHDALETRTRDDGERFTTTRDDAPEWVRDLVYRAHGDFLPDDWRYERIHDALAFISDNGYESGDDARDAAHEYADQSVDVYTGARLQWVASNLQRPAYADDAADDFGADGMGITERLGLGQYAEALEVFSLVVDALESRAVEVLNADA